MNIERLREPCPQWAAAELAALRAENARLKHDKEHLLTCLWDTTMALIRAHRGKRVVSP